MSLRFSSLAFAALLGLACLGTSTSQASPSRRSRKPAEPALPPAAATLTLSPAAEGPWTLRLTNEGTSALRVAADARLLRLEIELPLPAKAKKGAKPKTVVCDAPAGLRPEAFPEPRALLLAPGSSYEEAFDPRLLCFGAKAASLRDGVTVRARLGWESSKHAKASLPPFVVEGTSFPAVVAPLRAVETGPQSLPRPALPGETVEGPRSGGPSGASDATAGLIDANAGRLELRLDPWIDATRAREIVVEARVRNVGRRPLTVALRPRMLAFDLEGPSGRQHCDAAPPTNALSRESFRALRPGEAQTLSVLLREACPNLQLQRPGLHRLSAELHASEASPSSELPAWTGRLPSQAPAWVRLATGMEPYHLEPPKALAPAPPAAAPQGAAEPQSPTSSP